MERAWRTWRASQVVTAACISGAWMKPKRPNCRAPKEHREFSSRLTVNGWDSAGTKLNKISVEGRAVVPVVVVGISAGASWAVDGTIVVGGALNRGLQRFSPAGGQPAKLTDLIAGQI